eukprot:TRINITY_DN2012_c0_g1_i1.p1 TRINITY_DN2012_c0_g1~~TRINITY_DN2012_c0_g1_i1.p1  ORF type:complete len:158 (-),score=28.65 TRINITY_DN2012_c0_g1_i1:73-546(-)
MAKHHPDLIMCRKQPGIAIGRLCEKCDGKCVICDSYVRPCTLVRVCDECNYGSYQGRCVICGGPGISDAFYCKECTIQEKDVRATHSHATPLLFFFFFSSFPLSNPPPNTCSCSPARGYVNSFSSNSQRDGCPKIVNLGSSKTDLFYERKKYGFKKR